MHFSEDTLQMHESLSTNKVLRIVQEENVREGQHFFSTFQFWESQPWYPAHAGNYLTHLPMQHNLLALVDLPPY